MRRIWRFLPTIAMALSIFGCTPAPRPVIVSKPIARQIKYLGEINGKLGSMNLSSPSAITFDQANNLYIVDQGNNRIVKLAPDYQFIRDNGGFGLGINGLSRPNDIVSDGGINFYILDQGNKRVVRSDHDLVFADEIRFGSNPDLQALGKIVAIGYSRMGRMYLADPDNLKVVVLDKDFKIEQELVPAGGFSRCGAIQVVGDDHVYVYDRQDNALFRFDTFGNFEDKIVLEGTGEIGGFLIHDREIMATDKMKNEVVIFDMKGTRVASLGSMGSGPLNLNVPGGIGLRADGKLFVCDTGNNRIMIYELAAQ
jgi:DNA-binding beta-propeller fold protein YncE